MAEFFGDLSIFGMKGSEAFTEVVDNYIKASRNTDTSFIIKASCERFGSGEGKGLIKESLRGHDLFIIADLFNHGATYKMYGKEYPMSPDDHFCDIKRIIGAVGGKARRISVIMPMLYEGRQHKRSTRESLDCAQSLQELVAMGVTNIITFDAHDARVQNAIPLHGFDNAQPTYQMIKTFINTVPDLTLNADNVAIVSPDEGGMSRCMYYSSVLKLDLGMFYKRRDYSRIVNGTNPIVEHKYLGNSVEGKDVIIVDDMISSGGSMIDVAQKLKAMGAKRVFAFATFGLFCNGLEMFDKAYADGTIAKIFTTNLTYRAPEVLASPWYQEVDLRKYVALLIDQINRDGTISTLLDPKDKIYAYIDKAVAEGKLKV